MTFANVPGFPRAYKTGAVQIVPATGTTVTDLIQAGADGMIISTLTLTSQEAATARNIRFSIQRGGTGSNFVIGTINVPQNSGNNGINASVSPLLVTNTIFGAPFEFDANGNKVIILGPLDKLRVESLAAVTTGVTIFAAGADY
jgi:hypothetical protein